MMMLFLQPHVMPAAQIHARLSLLCCNSMAARAIASFAVGISSVTAIAHNSNALSVAIFDDQEHLPWLGSNLSLLGRSYRALTTFASTAVDFKWSTFQLDRESREYHDAREAVHGRAASRMLHVAQTNGGVYIKAGQFISAQTHLPSVYRRVLSVLQDRVAGRSLAAISSTVVHELGPLSTIFASFDPQPVATASLAQVHRAVDLSGNVVAVKIQHPELRSNIEVDINCFKLLSFLSNRVFDAFDLDWLVPEFAVNIRKEADFINEGKNCERAAANFKESKDVAFPKIHWNLTSARVPSASFCTAIFNVTPLHHCRFRMIYTLRF
jgi:aarF domain-containing kinase